VIILLPECRIISLARSIWAVGYGVEQNNGFVYLYRSHLRKGYVAGVGYVNYMKSRNIDTSVTGKQARREQGGELYRWPRDRWAT